MLATTSFTRSSFIRAASSWARSSCGALEVSAARAIERFCGRDKGMPDLESIRETQAMLRRCMAMGRPNLAEPLARTADRLTSSFFGAHARSVMRACRLASIIAHHLRPRGDTTQVGTIPSTSWPSSSWSMC